MMLGTVVALLYFSLAADAFRGKIYVRENITDYETCRPAVVNRSDNTVFPDALWIRIATSKHNFTLYLRINAILLSPRFVSRHISNGRENTVPGHASCFYQGEVIGYPHWTAVVSTCKGLRGSFGIAANGSLFHIEPLNKTSDSLNQLHALYFKNGQINEKTICGTPHSHNTSLPIFSNIEESAMKVKRQSTSAVPIVELAVINDQAQLQQFKGDVQATLIRAIEIINGVDNLYKVLGVRIALVEVTTWSTGNKIAVLSDSSTSLDNFAAYEPQIASHHDASLLLTGVKLNNNVIGIAYVGTMCTTRYAVGLIEDFSSAAAVSSTAAHELGHIFNMQHDSAACQCSQKTCIMSAVLGNPPSSQWSSCSKNTLKASLKSSLGLCLNNQPVSTVGPPAPTAKSTTMPPITTVVKTTTVTFTTVPPKIKKPTFPMTIPPQIVTTQKATIPSTISPSTLSPTFPPTKKSTPTIAATQLPNGSICGNKIREGNEACDCGTLKMCTDPCCNATTCQLSRGAQCGAGSCCANCHFMSYGTLCRRAVGECDIAEYCSGNSAECPRDQFVRDGTACAKKSGYCYNGNCPTRDGQCKTYYGQDSGDGPSICYTTYNTFGNVLGNCGSSNGNYIPCSIGFVNDSSQLSQCLNYGSQFPVGIPSGSVSISIHNSRQCKSFVQISNSSTVWTVNDGTQCGTNMLCIKQQCRNIGSQPQCPTTKGQICAGNGVCSTNGTCICNVGFIGTDCSLIHPG